LDDPEQCGLDKQYNQKRRKDRRYWRSSVLHIWQATFPNTRRNAYCGTVCSEDTGLVLVLLANCVNLHCLFSKLWTLTFKKQIPTAQKTQHLRC